MPIKPENRARYPKDWKAISLAIRERAENLCECRGECGQPHEGGFGDHFGRCIAPNGERIVWVDGGHTWVSPELAAHWEGKPVRIVLTVAHLDHQPENVDPSNLRAMCQRCHLRYDHAHHQANAKRTRERKSGQMRLVP